jgi:very-short-patch-repair endonuclease
MRRQRAMDHSIAALAGAQHGVVSRGQLLTLGLTVAGIDHRLRAGRLVLVHRGVYAPGHSVLRIEGRWMAAVLAAGGDAVLSHATAASAWDLRPIGAGAVHVTLPGDPGRRRRTGIRVHRSATLEPHDTTSHRAIPITTPARTLIDLAATLNGRALEQALDRAEHLALVDFAEFTERIAARPGRPGSPSLQALLSRYTAGSTFTRSELEERFLRLCDDHGLPRPETNISIEGSEVDFVWRDARLIVEVDGYRYHRSPSAFESDRERDVVLALAGWHVLRFTWAQLARRPAWVAAAVSRRLGGGGRRPPPPPPPPGAPLGGRPWPRARRS